MMELKIVSWHPQTEMLLLFSIKSAAYKSSCTVLDFTQRWAGDGDEGKHKAEHGG